MERTVRRFGTFTGVFLPTILSIFGVILFLRLGWCIGNAGLFEGLLIITLAMSISFVTGLSLSAIATNKEVGAGGVYYIVSRSFGLDIGGTIGIPLYISQAISVAFYLIGFAESLKGLFPNLNIVLVASVVLFIFAVIAYIGADFAVKMQAVIFIALVAGIASFAFNPHWHLIHVNILPHYLKGYDFWKVFAVFFPAVTGITAGIAMSGELKNPKKAIPLGIISSLLVSYAVYAFLAYKLAATVPYTILRKDTLIMVHSALVPALVYVGIWMATLSSALTFTIGAPRTLQALAFDGVIPEFFAATLGSKKKEPRLGVLITYLIAQGILFLGSLNVIASIITMFFLITYAATNLAAALYDLIKPPTYRPSFNVSWWISAYGVVGSYMVMFLIDPKTTLFATFLLTLLYMLLRRKKLKQTWGDIKLGIWVELAKLALLKVSEKEHDPKNWRPNILVFCGDPYKREYLVDFARFLSTTNGMITLANVIWGEGDREAELKLMKRFIKERAVDFFPKVVQVPKGENYAYPFLSQAYGIGEVESNIALFGWGRKKENQFKLVRSISNLMSLKKDILILNYNQARGFGQKRLIDLWWGGKGGNFALMTFIAFCLTRHYDWKRATIRVLKVSRSQNDAEKFKRALENLTERARIDAQILPIISDKPFKEVVKAHSSLSDLVIMGMSVPREGKEESFIKSIDLLSEGLGSVLFVRSMTPKDIWDIGD